LNVGANVPKAVQTERETAALLGRQISQHKAAEDDITVGYPLARVGSIVGCLQDRVRSGVCVRLIFRVSRAVMELGRNHSDPIRDISMHLPVIARIKGELQHALVQ
jgi:hypothetical protein